MPVKCTTNSPCLAVVDVICRESLHVFIPSVAELLNSYLDNFSGPGAFVSGCDRGTCIQTLGYLLDRESAICWRQAVENAASNGQLHVLKWMQQLEEDGRGPWTEDWDGAVISASRNGDLEVLRWLKEQNLDPNVTVEAMDGAAENGFVDVVQLLNENYRAGCTTEAMDLAAANGHLEVVQWLHRNRSEGCTTQAMKLAAENGHLEAVQWLQKTRGEKCTMFCLEMAARNGFLNVVQWLTGHLQEEIPSEVCVAAAEHGHLVVVKCLLENGVKCVDTVMDGAASHGHLNIVLWLHKNTGEGCINLDIRLARYLVLVCGHVEVLRLVGGEICVRLEQELRNH